MNLHPFHHSDCKVCVLLIRACLCVLCVFGAEANIRITAALPLLAEEVSR